MPSSTLIVTFSIFCSINPIHIPTIFPVAFSTFWMNKFTTMSFVLNKRTACVFTLSTCFIFFKYFNHYSSASVVSSRMWVRISRSMK